MTTTAVIADDEQLPREKLREFLSNVTWIECVGEAKNGPEAVSLVDRVKPDLLVLDIRMPGLSGLEVLRQREHRPTVVFTTAYDQYAVTAFELRALDYLLKPFGRKRFEQTVARIRDTLPTTSDVSSVERGQEALDQDRPLRRLFVRARGKIVPVAIDQVVRFEARDDYVALHTTQGRFLASMRMGDVEKMVDPDLFVRIHRSHIVNLDYVEAIVTHASGRLLVTLRDGAQLLASRARSQALRQRAV